MMLFLASDKKLPFIPWDDNANQNLIVIELDETNKSVMKQFTKKFVYDIGAYEGCGCGFKFGIFEPEDDDDKEAEAAGRRSVEELFNYLRKNMNRDDKIELYHCWAGDEGNNPEQIILINLSEFTLGNSFQFLENQFITIQG